MEKYFLFLDDRRTLKMAMTEDPYFLSFLKTTGYAIKIEKIKIVKNTKSFIKTIKEFGVPEFTSLDHDLADFFSKNGEKRERTGDTCAKWLCEYCIENNIPIPQHYVHSNNPAGKKNINATFTFYKKYAN